VRLDHLLSKESKSARFTDICSVSSLDTQLMHSSGACTLSNAKGARDAGTRSVFRCEGAHAPSTRSGDLARHLFGELYSPAFLENFIASTSIFVCNTQVIKGQRWMPWRQEPMKDVGGCEKLRGGADQPSIRRYPNGATPHPSWGVTPA
jgi:hypothetical protein